MFTEKPVICKPFTNFATLAKLTGVDYNIINIIIIIIILFRDVMNSSVQQAKTQKLMTPK